MTIRYDSRKRQFFQDDKPITKEQAQQIWADPNDNADWEVQAYAVMTRDNSLVFPHLDEEEEAEEDE